MEIKAEVDRYLEGKPILANWTQFGILVHIWANDGCTRLNSNFSGKQLTEEMYRILAVIQFASVDTQYPYVKLELLMDEVCKWFDDSGCLSNLYHNNDDCPMLPNNIHNVLTPYIIVVASYRRDDSDSFEEM